MAKLLCQETTCSSLSHVPVVVPLSPTEYQDAREEAGSEEQSGEPLRRSPRQHKHRRHVDDDSSIDDPDSEEEYTSGGYESGVMSCGWPAFWM